MDPSEVSLYASTSFDKSPKKSPKKFHIIWNDLNFNSMLWLVENVHEVVQQSVEDYDWIKWQSTLMDLAKAHVVVYHNILDEFDMAWCVEGLIATRNNVMIIWKIGPRMGIVS